MSFKPHDRTKPYKRRSPAQEAQMRVLRVRGLYYHAYALSGWRARVMRLLCDAELLALGQETQTARDARKRRELDERLAAEEAERRKNESLWDEIPF